MKKYFKKVFLFANILLVLLTIGSYVAPHIAASKSALFPILGLGYPVLLLCNILSILLWLILKSKWAGLSIITLLVGYGSCTKLLNVNLADQHDGTRLILATYNVNFSKPITLAPQKTQAKLKVDFRKYLKAHSDIDILCVQENGKNSKQFLQEALNFEFVHEVAGMTVTIYSRYPVLNSGVVDFSSTIANTCLWADVLITTDSDKDTIRVYTTHLESNRKDGVVPEVIHEEAPEEMSNSALLGIVKHHQKFSIQRARQAKLIKTHAQGSQHPAIICGDFNETAQSQIYTLLRGDYQDTFQEEGMGIASTFGERIPALRIDHILVDKRLEVLDHTISRSAFSDHYLVIAELGL